MLDWAPPFIPNTAVIDPLIASGKITLIKNEALSYKLNTWPRVLDVITLQSNFLRESLFLNMDFLSEYHQYKDIQFILGKKGCRLAQVISLMINQNSSLIQNLRQLWRGNEWIPNYLL